MPRTCPKGYQMVNGVCQQAISNKLTPGDTSIVPGGGDSGRTACIAYCEDAYPFSGCSSFECNCSCCHSWPVYQDFNNPSQITDFACSCNNCFTSFMSCIASCFGAGGGSGPGFGRGVRHPGASPGGWRRGGRIKRRRRR